MSRFDDLYRRSLEQREEFWPRPLAIDWWSPGSRYLDDSRHRCIAGSAVPA